MIGNPCIISKNYLCPKDPLLLQIYGRFHTIYARITFGIRGCVLRIHTDYFVVKNGIKC